VDWLRARLAEGDFTPRGLVVELAGPGLRVDDRKMWAFAQVEGLGLRKRRRWPVSRSDRTLPANARAGRRVRAASTPNGLSSPKRPVLPQTACLPPNRLSSLMKPDGQDPGQDQYGAPA
jgi:hypothetical protein